MKQTLFILLSIIIMGMTPQTVMAQRAPMAEASAQPHVPTAISDNRVTKLKAYLELHNSPMSADAEHFITEADRLKMDWKLVAAIAGVESTFGKHVPANSYNGWGWAIFTGQKDGRHFDGWKDGITVVSEGLRYNYMDKGLITIEQMGMRYAASPTWSVKVRYFLQKIEDFDPTGVEHLAVTI